MNNILFVVMVVALLSVLAIIGSKMTESRKCLFVGIIIVAVSGLFAGFVFEYWNTYLGGGLDKHAILTPQIKMFPVLIMLVYWVFSAPVICFCAWVRGGYSNLIYIRSNSNKSAGIIKGIMYYFFIAVFIGAISGVVFRISGSPFIYGHILGLLGSLMFCWVMAIVLGVSAELRETQ